ncbi:PilW family protein [Candidatus Omnitrophota bacterium]
MFRKNVSGANKKGLTLLEVMVTTCISTVLFSGIYMTFIFGHKTSRHYSENVKKRQQLRMALNWMTRELREAENIFLVEADGEVRLTFFKKKVGDVLYLWTGVGKDKGVLRRFAPMKDRILARGIDSLIISHPKSNIIMFQIASGKDKKQVFLKGQVVLRNQLTTLRSWGKGL